MPKMCVETLRTGLVYPRQSIWEVTCLHLLEKWTFSNLSPWKPQKCVYEIPRTGLVFAGQSIWGVTCLGLFSKWMFCYLSPWKPQNSVLKPSEEGSFLPDNQFEGSHAYIYLKNEHFPIYLLGNCINVCWNPQNRAHFLKMINLRGHMPMFTLKINAFPSISLRTPKLCVETLRRGIVLARRSIWGVTCLHLLEKWTFSNLSPWKPQNSVLKPSEQGSFFQMIDVRGHMPTSFSSFN